MFNWLRSLFRSGLSIAVAILLSAIIVSAALMMKDRYTFFTAPEASESNPALVKYDSLTGRCWLVISGWDEEGSLWSKVIEIRDQETGEVAH